jgi:hypothetical protein
LRAPSRAGAVQRQVDHDGAPLAALQRRHVPDRRPGAEPTGVLEEDAHANATRDGTGQADRSEGLSGCAADGRILPDAHGPAFHRADRDALCVGGQERRRVVEAQEEAEEAHGFERQSEEGSINLSSVPSGQTDRATGYESVGSESAGTALGSWVMV